MATPKDTTDESGAVVYYYTRGKDDAPYKANVRYSVTLF